MIEQPENQNNVLTSSVSQNPVASELDGDSIDSAVQNALTENALNQNKKTQILTPVQQLTPIENAVNETIKRNNESNKTALNQSLVSASAKDPDTVAKSQALAASLNVSTGVVDFDIELAKRQKLLRQAEVMKLVEKYPSLARRFLDKEFAEVAHDDLDNLAKTSDLSNQLRGNLPVGMGSGDNTLFGETATKYASEMFTDFERGMISGTNTTTYGELAYRAQIPVLTIKDFAYAPQRSILEQRPDLEQSIQYAESVVSGQEEYRGTWSESFGTIIGQMSSMMVEASAVGTAFGGAAAIAGQLGPQIALPEEVITVPAAVSLGFTTSLIDQTRKVETGSAFVEYYRGSEDYEPLPYEEAAWAANIVGTLNASIELASTAFFFVPLASALPKAFLKKSIVNAFRKAITKSGATRAAATHLVKSTATEIGTEVVQEGTIVVAREITGVLTEPDFQSALSTQEGRDRLEERFSSIFEVTLKGTVPLAFITGGFGLAHQMRNIARSQKRQKLITDQIATKVESKVNKRSKTTYNSYLAEQLSGESLHIGVEQFEQARRKNGVGLQEVEKIIPGITEQVAKAKASGGDVVIPTSLYLSELIDTEFGVSIRNDIRADAEGKSINDIAEDEISRKEFLKELKQEIEDFKKTNKDWAESAGNIEEEVFAKIKAAGNYTEEEARMLAQWHRDIAVVLASRFRMTPEQFNAKFGLSIESAYTPEQQAPAQQINVGDTITVYGFNGTPQQVLVIAKSSKGTIKIKLADGTEEIVGSGMILTLQNPKDPSFVINNTELATKPGVWDHSLSSLSNDEISVLIENRKKHLRDLEEAGNSELGKDSAMIRWNQDLIALESEVARRLAQQAPAQGSFEQASRADLGLGQQAAPAPDSGVFDANNPPVSSEAIFALMDADGKIYYDINATMHGDLVETFPDITDTVIDGGFIVNGKYMMGKSDGGYSAFEGEQKQIDAVRNFTEQANTQGFQESNYRPAVVAWAKEKFGDRTAPDGSTVWQNFTEWFGDSKVVDADGKPMVVYHGTKKTFQTFKSTDQNGLIYFSFDSEFSKRYASKSGGFKDPEADIQQRIDNARIAQKEITTPLYKELESKYKNLNDIPNEEYVAILEKGREIERSLLDGMTASEASMRMGVRVIDAYMRASNIFDPTTMWEEFLPVITEVLARTGETPISNSMMEHIKGGHYLIWEHKDVVEAVFQKYDAIKLRESMIVGEVDTIAVRDPSQVKSASANTGEFSATDPNILRQSAVDTLQMVAERGQRIIANNSRISAEERIAITTSSKATGVSESEIESAIRKTKLAHPIDQGWAKLVYSRTILDVNGKAAHEFQTIPYDFSTDSNGDNLEVGTKPYTDRVASMAKSMTEEVRSVLRRAKSGDKNALNILSQAAWYKSFRSRLRQEFGGLGDFVADLLGATSPNTPVRGNYWNAIDSLRRATRGDFDSLMPKWEEWANNLDTLETDLKSWFNTQLASGKTRADIRRMPEFAQKLAEVKSARTIGDELLPTKDTGMKYGFNGRNVVRAMVNLWRVVKDADTDIERGGTAPKAITFSGNLIGFRSRATIDVWAARNLQRLNGGKRIPSAAESGVSGVLKQSGDTTLQFGFGQDVFTEAVKFIRNDSELKTNNVLSSINDDDLQALVWFIEKEIWTINDWTSVAGEGGSFELEANLSGTSKQERVTELRRIVDASPKSADVNMAKTDTLKAVKAIEDFNDLHKDEIKELQDLKTGKTPEYKGSKKRIKQLESLTKPKSESEAGQAIRLLANIGRASDRLQEAEANKKAAKAELVSLERSVDRFVGGLSIQKSMATQGVDFVPQDSDMAQLSNSVTTAIYDSDPNNVVVASKALPTQGRYGGVERALDLEVIAREGYNANILWKEILTQAKEARQDSTFLARVLRTDEIYDPVRHRPGIEIYFRESVSGVELENALAELAKNDIEFLTVVVDGRRQSAFVAGAMPSAVGVRVLYTPEFEQRYAMDNMSGMDDVAIAAKIKEKSKELAVIAAKVIAAIPNVSFAGQFWYDVQVAFSHQYQEKIDGITTTEPEGISGTTRTSVWQGQSIRSGIEDANRQIRETTLRQSSRDVFGGNESRAKPARGWFNPKQLKMMLGSKSDFTTFIHELAHYNLTVLGRIASDPQSPSQIREDMDTTLSWFGIAGETPEQRLANWNAMTLEEQRRHHETFAYNHEIYLSEGKSPSIEMQGVFERFSQFVKRIYISIRDDLNAIYKQEFGTDLPMMTGEIRRVMDRMIATDEQIRSAEERRNMENIFKDQELSGMDDAQWASYQQMRAEATQKSVSELNEQSLAATTWASRLKAKKVKEIEAEQEELRSEIRKQVKKEVESRNVYRAIKFLKYGILQTAGGEEVEFTGSNKLNTNAVKLMVPKENMDKFGSGKNGMVALDGYHPDIVSERFNYSSGDELILAILDAKPMDEVIDGITEDRMEIENGELNSPQAIEAAADKAVHNEARVKLVAVELRWLTKATQPVRAMIAAAKSVAKQMLETKRLRDIKPGDYASAAARAAKESQTAYFASQSAETAAKTAYTRHYNKMIAEGAEEAKAVEMATKVSDEALAKAESRSEAHKKKYGKMKPSEVAAQAKRSQLLQEQLALEANDAIDQVKKSLKYLRNVLSDKNVQKIGADNSDQIALLLERFELKNISLKEMDKRTSLANWIASQLELGLEVDISKELIEQTNKIPYRNLTLSEFNDLVDAVKTIEYMGKNKNAILTDAKKAAFKETRDEIVKSIIENAGDRKASTRTAKSGTIDAVIYPIKSFIAAQFKAASVVRILDGGKDDGDLWNYLIRSANKSGDKETTMRATATEAVSKILAPFFKSGRMGGKGKMFNSVNESLNREEKLVIALNMGNEGNIQRMLDGYGWTLEQVIPILESMTTEELNAVQEIWDHFETYKNEISAKSRRIYGKDLDFVEPTPIQIKSASGDIVSLRGGYYPAKYDPMASSKAQNLDEAETAKQLLRAAHISATTSRGYSKQRATEVFDQPLIRNLSALYSGLNEVIHDLSWHEWTIDANKLMRDNAFDKEIRNRYGSLFTDQLKSWIQDVAAGDKAMDTGMDIPLNFLRQGISSAGLGFNLTSAALQVTGFNQSIIRVGPKYIGYGIMQVMKRGTGAFQEVNELSDFMANRSRTQFRELNELRNRIRGQSAVMKKVRMGTYFLMMKMQRSVDVPTWIGAYAKQLEINPDEQLAIDIADQTVIDTQGGGQIKDLSGVERGGAGAKLFTVFYGYMNTVYNMAAVETMTEKKRGKLAAKYVMLFVVPVVLSYALKQLLRPKKDDDDEFDLVQLSKDLSIEQIEYLMGTMVVAREFSQIARTMIDPSAPSMGYSGPAGLRTIKDTYTAATQFGQGEFDSAFRKSAINLIGDISGLPSAQVNRTIDGIEALMEDETTDIRAPLFGVRK